MAHFAELLTREEDAMLNVMLESLSIQHRREFHPIMDKRPYFIRKCTCEENIGCYPLAVQNRKYCSSPHAHQKQNHSSTTKLELAINPLAISI